MRTIKFRGKKLHNGKWVCGYLSDVDNTPIGKVGIINSKPFSGCEESSMVIAETIGQFTSLYDRNKKEIYEGDLLKLQDDDTGLIEVRFVRGVFAFLWQGDLDDELPINAPTQEWATVVGNIHDNPEKLKR